MHEVAKDIQIGGIGGVMETRSSQDNNTGKLPRVSHMQIYAGPCVSGVAEHTKVQGGIEQGALLSPLAHRIHASRSEALDGLPSLDQQIRILPEQTEFNSIQLPARHPAEQANRMPPTGAERATPRTVEQVRAEAKHLGWCKGLNEAQAQALARFMTAAGVRPLASVPHALPLAVATGARAAFEAACAVYESGLGDINVRDGAGMTCLHKMTVARGTGVPSLSERFERAISLGADPFLADKRGLNTVDLAARHGRLEPLLQAMSKSLPPQEVDRLLQWKDTQGRNILSCAAGLGAGALAAVRTTIARKLCGHVKLQIDSLSHLQQTSATQCGQAAWATVDTAEQLAVMLALGGDPFFKGDDGKQASPFELAQSRGCTEITGPLSTLKQTLHGLATAVDSKHMSAICHASSAGAVNFLCDLGVNQLRPLEDITVPAALGQWLRRNPGSMASRLGQSGNHALKSAPIDIITTYLDAIRTRPDHDDGYRGDIHDDLRSALYWHETLVNDQTIFDREGFVTLFNCSESMACAETLLKARMEAGTGDQEWQNWCNNEWEYVLNNPGFRHKKQGVPSLELADLLRRHDIRPSEAILENLNKNQSVKYAPDISAEFEKATELWEKLRQDESEFDSLSKAEWALAAAHAYRVVLFFPESQCKTSCVQLAKYLGLNPKCDTQTRLAFLQTAHYGQVFLGTSDELAVRRRVWRTAVGYAGYAFLRKESGKLSDIGDGAWHHAYVSKCTNLVEELANKTGP